jgi:hypothetical protein
MRMETVLWWLTVVCAVLLVLGSLQGRTRWVKESANARQVSTIRDAAGWDAVAILSGTVAIVALVVGRWARLRPVVAVLCAATAAAAFGAAAVAAGRYWLDLTRGAGQIEGYVMQPATGPPLVAVLAVVGAGCALALGLGWLRPTAER